MKNKIFDNVYPNLMLSSNKVHQTVVNQGTSSPFYHASYTKLIQVGLTYCIINHLDDEYSNMYFF